MSLAVALIADDLTGALDATAPFAARGLSTVVATTPAAIERALAAGAAVVGVSTGTRERRDDAAVTRAAEALRQARPGIVFKKIDSRLKGALAAETAAILDAFVLDRILLSPAIPDLGRTVAAGKLSGFGIAEPIDIAARFTGIRATIAIPDDDALISTVAGALAELPPPLFVGARGLAMALAAHHGDAIAAPAFPAPGRTLVVVGSTDPITIGQVTRLRTLLPASAFHDAPNGLLPPPVRIAGDIAVLVAAAAETALPSGDVAVNLAAAAERLVKDLVPDTLILTGGETAAAVLGRLRLDVLSVAGEALPGLPFAEASLGPRPLTIVTKSGGFGGDDTLATLLGLLDGGGAAPRLRFTTLALERQS